MKYLLFLLFIFIGVFLLRPQWLVNKYLLSLAAKVAATQGVDVKWKEAFVHIESHSLFEKHFEFSFQDLCFRVKKADVSGCSEDITFAFSAHFGHWIPRVFEIGPVHIQDLEWKVSESIHGLISLVGKENTGGELQNLGRWSFEFSGTTHLPENLLLQTDGWLQLKGNRLKEAQAKYSIDVQMNQHRKIKKEKPYVSAHLEGLADLDHIQTELTGKAVGWLEELPQVAVKQCNLELSRSKAGLLHFNSEGRFQTQCPVLVKIPIPPLDIAPGVHLPTELGAILRADVKTSSLIPSVETRLEGPASLVLDPILTPLFQGEGKLDAKVNGMLAEFPQRGTLDGDLEIRLKVPSFENLVRRLKNSSWAVPAPFHVLVGSGEFQIYGQSTLQQGKFPFSIQTRLISRGQALDLDGKGQAEFKETEKKKWMPSVNFDLILSNVQLALPRLDWAVPPKFLPDSRIKKTLKPEPEKKEEEPSFRYQITLRTLPDKPVRILSNLVAAPIPVALNLNLSESSPILGKVDVLTFPVEAFRRKATLDHFDLALHSPSSNSPIDGLLQVDYADYIVTVHLEGTVSKPTIQLTSEPALPENQLFAVLLFGQPIEELDPEQADSVGGARAAVASGAMSLASLYVLASTPIQSLNYDPTSKTLSAKIRLGDGTSLNLGTGDTTSVGIRRRLGPSWSIETDISNLLEQKGVASAYLQWSRRY